MQKTTKSLLPRRYLLTLPNAVAILLL